MDDAQVIKIDLSEKYIVILKNVEFEDAERFALRLKEWQRTDETFFLVPLAGDAEIKLEKAPT